MVHTESVHAHTGFNQLSQQVFVVNTEALAWRVLGMMPSVRKSATLAQSDQLRKEHRLRLHHACFAHVVDMVNRFCGEDKHVLCADGQVHTCFMY